MELCQGFNRLLRQDECVKQGHVCVFHIFREADVLLGGWRSIALHHHRRRVSLSAQFVLELPYHGGYCLGAVIAERVNTHQRSEERRVGKEWRERRTPERAKTKG